MKRRIKTKKRLPDLAFRPVMLSLLVLGLVLFLTLFIYLDYYSKNRVNSSISALGRELSSAGIAVEEFDVCEKDDSVKFSTKTVCGAGLKHSPDKGTVEDFNNIIKLLEDQSIFIIDKLTENKKIDGERVSSYSPAYDSTTDKKCNISISYGYSTTPTLLFMRLWCSK